MHFARGEPIMTRLVAGIWLVAVAVIPSMVSATACKDADALAMQFTPPMVPNVNNLHFVDSKTGSTLKFIAEIDPELPHTWTYSHGALLNLSTFNNFHLLSEACLRELSHIGPKPVLLAGKCYGLIRVTAAPTCWSLQVKTDPPGYPFEVEAGGKPQLHSGFLPQLKQWNLVANLSREQLAKVVIYQRADNKPAGNKLPISIPVTYSRLSGEGGHWDLAQGEIADNIVFPYLGRKSMKGANEDVLQLRRQRLYRTDPALRRLVGIKLLLADDGDQQ